MPKEDSVRVMLIDDRPDMRRLVEMWLEGTIARVVGQADCCAEAFAVLERQEADVAVMDMHMPGRNGVECTRDLLQRHPGLLVIAFSSSDDEAVEGKMRAAGVTAYFHKSRLHDLVACLTSPGLSELVQEQREG